MNNLQKNQIRKHWIWLKHKEDVDEVIKFIEAFEDKGEKI
jgi:hypothetical protein